MSFRHRTRLWLQALEDRRTPATFTVTTNADSGAGTLRQAIEDSNAAIGADSIVFDSSFSTAKTVSLLSALPTITEDLTISGPGSKLLTVTRDISAANFRIFTIKNLDTVQSVSMSGMKLTNGYNDATARTDNGGAIYCGASNLLTLDSMEIVGNTSTAQGGGIAMDARSRLTITNSTISGNTALGMEYGQTGFTGVGGGIYFTLDGDLTLINSTVDNNVAKVSGGGVFLYGESLGTSTIRNTTISSNTVTSTSGSIVYIAGGAGIAVLNNSFAGGKGIFYLNVQNSTITGNVAVGGGSQGGGIQLSSRSFTSNLISARIESTVVAGNSASNAPDIYGDDTLFSTTQKVVVDYSAIGSTVGFTLTPGPGGSLSNQFGSFPLGALAYNPSTANVRTHLPPAGSALIDKGSNPASLGTDARGWSRYYDDTTKIGGPADVGAVEVQPAGLPTAVGSAPTIIASSFGAQTVTVVYQDDVGISTPTVNNNDILVTGPSGSGYAKLGTFVSKVGSGTSVTATYTVPPLTAPWTAAHDGVYIISVVSGAVTDGTTAVPAGPIGTFQVAIPRTILVTTTSDTINASDNKTSLREAIAMANELYPSNDTIEFDTGINYITWSSLGQMFITDSVTIKGGVSAGALTLDGNTTSRHFNIDGPGRLLVTISGVQMVAGQTKLELQSERGGSIYNNNEDLVMDNVIMLSNTSSKSYGGAIHIQGQGSLTFKNGRLQSNTSPSYAGGAISALDNGHTISIINSTMAANSAAYYGGALFSSGGGTVSIDRSTIRNNSTTSVIADDQGGTIITGGGGGIMVANGKVIDGDVLVDNLQAKSSLTVLDSLFDGNSTAVAGGAIEFNGNTTGVLLRNSTFVNNQTTGNTQDNVGGAVLVGNLQNNPFLIDNCTFAYNKAYSGGGLFIENDNVASTIANSTIFAQNSSADITQLPPDFDGNLTAHYCFFGIVDGAGIQPGSSNNIGNGALGSPIDPKFEVLDDYGGPTFTLALKSNSPCLNTGSNPLNLSYDQRGVGYPRSSGGAPDIGAFERQQITPPPPTVLEVTFGDGNQRSMVKQITIVFSETVAFSPDVVSAFTLSRTGTGGNTGPVDLIADPLTGPTQIVTLTFTGQFAENGSLVDGLYDFIISAGVVSGAGGPLDGNNDTIPGGNYSVTGTTTNKYFRLFGDSDGSGQVDFLVDFIAFRNAFANGGPSAVFDFDNSNTVDFLNDFIAFRNRFNATP